MIGFSELIREGKHIKVFVESISTPYHSNRNHLLLIKNLVKNFFFLEKQYDGCCYTQVKLCAASKIQCPATAS